ncbi:MAG: acyl-CoA dehydrogenase family protein [Parvibaculum sp.]|nr:acyl-CoA dehydrogenase family protein [Parvibaculum sp.]
MAKKTSADLLAAAERFAPEIAERAAEIEANRFLPQDMAKRFAEAGLYRLCVPEVYGGLESHPGELVKVVERIAQADGSAADGSGTRARAMHRGFQGVHSSSAMTGRLLLGVPTNTAML